jgi:hypothetical protein
VKRERCGCGPRGRKARITYSVDNEWFAILEFGDHFQQRGGGYEPITLAGREDSMAQATTTSEDLLDQIGKP